MVKRLSPSLTSYFQKYDRRTASITSISIPSKLLNQFIIAGTLSPLLALSNAHSATQEIVVEPSTALFLECASLNLASARLACYDKVANKGEATLVAEKQPLDIVKTVKATINERKPHIVLANESQLASEQSNSINNDINTAKELLPINSDLSDDDILAKVGVTQAEVHQYTPLSLAYDLDKNSELGVWSARPYNPVYLLPVYAMLDPNRSPTTPTQETYEYTSNEYRAIELKAQLSLKTKVVEDLFDTNADLWFGYTQQMHWQVYNEDNSRPFRANDYMPEVFLTQPVKASLPFNGELRMLGVGAIHHSNGQSDPLSRSWNRLYLMGGAEWGNLSVIPKLWTHVKRETEANPTDNPDITDYYGHGDIQALYDFGRGQTVGITGRMNFSEGKGAVQVEYTHPFDENLYGYLQLFHGYGESIIDYNHSATSIGVGITLSDWQGL